MRNYGKVFSHIWRDEDFMCLPCDAQRLFLFLLTNEFGNALGCYRMSQAHIADELRCDIADIELAEKQLEEIGYLLRDNRWLIMPRYLDHYTIENGNVALSCLKVIESMPRDFAFIGMLLEKLSVHESKFSEGALDTVAERFGNRFEGVTEPSPSGFEIQNLNQNLNQNQRPENILRSTHSVSQSNSSTDEDPSAKRKASVRLRADFDEFYAAYPRKKAPGDAERAYAKARKHATREQILAGAKALAASNPEMQYTPYPATWLNKRQWEDQVAGTGPPHTETIRDQVYSLAIATARREARDGDEREGSDGIKALGQRVCAEGSG